ncbi:MAG: hypothetical protein GF418_06715 [Chitinivibrionales bacterium]|nr:hypothetical protein [Chitinivibrionales bacterium]MBD3395303.1 hypothetical protein [Chitinivibrionales bacterium]
MNEMSEHSRSAYIHGLLAPFFKEMQYWQHVPEREGGQMRERPAVSREYDEMNTREPDPSQAPREDKSVTEYVPRERVRGHAYPRREASAYAHTLEKAAEFSNAVLARHKSAYRFRVYEENAELYVDLIALNRKGEAAYELVRKITHDDFLRWINDLRDAEGLVVDEEV